MNALTYTAMRKLTQMIHPDTALDDTTLAYLRSLLTPYASAIEPATSEESVLNWIDAAFFGELAKHGRAEAQKALAKQEDDDDATRLAAVKTATVEYLLAEMIELAGNRARDYRSGQILPWDVRYTIFHDEELSRMFPGNEFTLPVQVTVSGQTFTHELSADFVAGLFAFYRADGSMPPVTTLFGEQLRSTFDLDYVDPEDGEVVPDGRYADDNDYNSYSINVGDELYTFNTLDYIRGLSTAAQWLNKDVHSLASGLQDVSADPPQELTF